MLLLIARSNSSSQFIGTYAALLDKSTSITAVFFFVFFGFVGVFCLVLVCLCFELFVSLFGLQPHLDLLDCVLVHAPMREHTGLCTIRSMAQTLCYDLARAEKAKDGKKSKISSRSS